jgi:hypothetical protein
MTLAENKMSNASQLHQTATKHMTFIILTEIRFLSISVAFVHKY